jgi:hypothetical protein
MSQDATDLLARWIAENVHAVPEDEQKSEAAQLAAEFIAYAKDAGLSAADMRELELDLEEDIESYLEDAIEAARAHEDGRSVGDME